MNDYIRNQDLLNQLIDDFVEVTLPKQDNFLKVKETLTRIGIASPQQKKLFQSCHILHKRGKYYICHFKELFVLDGKIAQTNFSEEDKARRNTIANLLAEWGLITLVNPKKSLEPRAQLSMIKVLSYKEKNEWTLVPKYNIGKKKKAEEVSSEV